MLCRDASAVVLLVLVLAGCENGQRPSGGMAIESPIPDSRPGRTILPEDPDAVAALKRAGAAVVRVLGPLNPLASRGSGEGHIAAQDVDLSGVPLTPEVIRQLNAVPGVTRLTLSGPFVDDEVLKSLACGEWLRALDLSASNITNEGLRHLTPDAFPSLSILTLNETLVSGEGLKSLPQLSVLNLADTEIGDEDLLQLGAQDQLMLLTLTGTQVTATGIAELKRLIGRETVVVWGGAVPSIDAGSAASASRENHEPRLFESVTSPQVDRARKAGTSGRKRSAAVGRRVAGGRLISARTRSAAGCNPEWVRSATGAGIEQRSRLLGFQRVSGHDGWRRQRWSPAGASEGASGTSATGSRGCGDDFAAQWICRVA